MAGLESLKSTKRNGSCPKCGLGGEALIDDCNRAFVLLYQFAPIGKISLEHESEMHRRIQEKGEGEILVVTDY